LGEEGTDKTVYQYNAAGNLILETSVYEWNDATGREIEESNTGYDDRGNIILKSEKYIYEFWDEFLQRYIVTDEGEYKSEYSYDHLNWKTSEIDYSWENNKWSVSYKNEYAYTDNANSYVETVTHSWGNSSSDKYENTYSGQRQMRSPSRNNYEEFVSGSSFPALPSVWNTDSEKNLLATVTWDNNGYGLNLSSKTEYIRNDNGVLIRKNYWEWANNTWNESGRTEFDYNAQGLLIAETGSNS
jgi:hypothetical protein